MGRLFRLLLLLLLPVSAALGQDNPTPQLQPRTAAPPAPTNPNREITLDVQVTDKSGAPVRGLQQRDFTVLDDKRPQNIISFHAVDNGADSTADPVELVLVVDAVNTSFNAITYARTELKKFLLQNGGKLARGYRRNHYVGVDRRSGPLGISFPARLFIVKYHVQPAPRGRRHHRNPARFFKALVRIKGFVAVAAVARND